MGETLTCDHGVKIGYRNWNEDILALGCVIYSVP